MSWPQTGSRAVPGAAGRLVAGLDVGNTTTEVVLAQAFSAGVVPLAWDRAPTRSAKGSAASLRGAAVLLRRLERRLGRQADLVVAAPLRPVRTSATSLAQAPASTGRLEVVAVGGATHAGTGVGVGVPVWVDAEPVTGVAVVLMVAPGTGFTAAASAVASWMAAGAQVVAVLLADDEAVLVSARLPPGGPPLPVVDQVDVARLASALMVAVEVRPAGQTVRALADPIRLSWMLGLDPAERATAVSVAAAVGSLSRAVVALRTDAAPAARPATGSVTLAQGSMTLVAGVGGAVRVGDVGAVQAWRPGPGPEQPVDDLWLVELGEAATSVAARIDPVTAGTIVVAALTTGADVVDPAAALAAELGRPIQVVASEAAASRAGAITSPGVRDPTVVDLGGGTIDAVASSGREVVAAGAGEMLTVAVAAFLGVPSGAADWVKRGPSSRLEAPQVLLSEDGDRTFLEQRAPSAAVGSLVVPGPAGLLPFGASMAPAQWRALRLRIKQRVLAENVVRVLRCLDAAAGDVLLVGGAAADDELLALLGPLVPGMAVGRGDVAGRLGHRYAVAFGLTVLAAGT